VIEIAAALFILIVISLVFSSFVMLIRPDPRPGSLLATLHRHRHRTPIWQRTNRQGVVALIVVALIVTGLVALFVHLAGAFPQSSLGALR
jgi:hypothetical protein